MFPKVGDHGCPGGGVLRMPYRYRSGHKVRGGPNAHVRVRKRPGVGQDDAPHPCPRTFVPVQAG